VRSNGKTALGDLHPVRDRPLGLGDLLRSDGHREPEEAGNPDAGRSVELIERMRIRDDGQEVVFKYPYQLQIGDDGSVYFANGFEHFKYDAQGRFVYRIVKSGQGPGEAQWRQRPC